MSFAFPSFLWALFVLAIPVLIHLFNFRKTKRIYFSNNRLLKQIKQETTQKRKLKQLLVLASRMLFLFFLVLAFAQPFLPAKEQMASSHNVVVYLDNSQSMSGKVAEKTRAIDDGMARVREIITVFPSETRFKLITNDFTPFSNTYKTKAEIEDILSQIRLSPISHSFEEIKIRMEVDKSRLDVFWISDFQQSTLGKLSPLDSSNQWHLVPVAYEKSISNVFVDSVYRDNPFTIGGEKNTITARFYNAGDVKREDLVVKCIINNIQAATTTFSCEANSYAEVSFDLPTGLKKVNQAKFIVNDFPVSFDNEFFFAINFGDKIKVTEIKNTPSVSSIESVFGNKELFDFKSFLAANVNYSWVKAADLVVVSELASVDASLQTTLKDYQAGGGAILLIPSNKLELSSYQSIVKGNRLSILKSTDFLELEKPAFQNPFFENVFEERSNLIAMPKAKKFLAWGADPSALLKFKDGQPFLSQMGKTFLLASPLNTDFTDFHNHALFVPVMYRIAASGKREIQHLYYSLDDSFVSVRGDSVANESQVKMVGTQEIIPTQRRNGENILLELPRFIINPGLYSIVSKTDTLDLLALNLTKKESFLKQFSGEEMKSNLGGGKNISLFNSSNASTFSSEIKERFLGTTLWKEALLLALTFLLVEVLLIRFLK